jgi:hypothetical protein
LPTPQNLTFQGAVRPFAWRQSLMGLRPAKFTYCTQSASSCATRYPRYLIYRARLRALRTCSKNRVCQSYCLRLRRPPFVYHGGSFVFWSHTVLPMIGIGKATPRPAEVRNFESPQSFDNILSYAIRIGMALFSPT